MILKERNLENDSFVIISNNNFSEISNQNISMNEEQIFLEQKQEIERIKNQIQNKIEKNGGEKNQIKLPQLQIKLTDEKFFESTYFKLQNSNSSQNIIPEFGEKWNEEMQLNPNNFKIENLIELSNLAIRTINEIDYSIYKMTISINLILKGESEFWLMTRCFVKDEIENGINKSSNVFDKYSSVMKITKENTSTRCFVHFGTFYEDKNSGEIKYKTFFKRQLIEYVKNKVNYSFLENDSCEFKVELTDMGIELIKAQIKMNDSEISNELSANFYLPIHKKAKIIIAGSGYSVQVKNLVLNVSPKDDQFFSNEAHSCGCCIVF